jgi:DNA helicase HerA-like ATPase
MRINWGISAFEKEKRTQVVWDSRDLINGHMLILGDTGTGKSHMLRDLVRQLDETKEGPVRYHVFDAHGDMGIAGSSSVMFSESTRYGYNPLAINADPHFGGPRKRIQGFLSGINRTSRKLGSNQESVLRRILYDLYQANGFRDGEPAPWAVEDPKWNRAHPKKFPQIIDALRFANSKAKELYLGANSETITNLNILARASSQYHNKVKGYMKGSEEEKAKLEKDIEAGIAKTASAFTDYLTSIKTGYELDNAIKYDSYDVMQSVTARLENLNGIGIFGSTPPPFDNSTPVWHYNISPLNEDEKKLFVHFRLEYLFERAVQRGEQKRIVEVFVVDEAHLYFSDDADNILNKTAKELRKFGVALIAASQSPSHFSPDFLSSVGSKVILGIDQLYWPACCRLLSIDAKALQWIQPQRRMIVQMKKTRQQSATSWVWLNNHT